MTTHESEHSHDLDSTSVFERAAPACAGFAHEINGVDYVEGSQRCTNNEERRREERKIFLLPVLDAIVNADTMEYHYSQDLPVISPRSHTLQYNNGGLIPNTPLFEDAAALPKQPYVEVLMPRETEMDLLNLKSGMAITQIIEDSLQALGFDLANYKSGTVFSYGGKIDPYEGMTFLFDFKALQKMAIDFLQSMMNEQQAAEVFGFLDKQDFKTYQATHKDQISEVLQGAIRCAGLSGDDLPKLKDAAHADNALVTGIIDQYLKENEFALATKSATLRFIIPQSRNR